MSKTEFLKKVKSLLKGIVAQRTYLMKHKASHLDSNFARQEISNIEYAIPRLVDAARAKAYIERKETALRYLIPATNPKRQEELRKLIETSLN
jgi:hypothetical protein